MTSPADQPFVSLGRDLAHLGQTCSHSPTDTDDTNCPNGATWHILWTFDGDAGLSCDPHMTAARRFVFVDSHRIEPDCAMPGAYWDMENQRCFYLDDPAPALAVARAHIAAHFTSGIVADDLLDRHAAEVRATALREAAELGRELSRQGYSAQEIANRLDRMAEEARS